MQNPVDLKTLQWGEYRIHVAMQNCKHQQNGMQKNETYQWHVSEHVQVPHIGRRAKDEQHAPSQARIHNSYADAVLEYQSDIALLT